MKLKKSCFGVYLPSLCSMKKSVFRKHPWEQSHNLKNTGKKQGRKEKSEGGREERRQRGRKK